MIDLLELLEDAGAAAGELDRLRARLLELVNEPNTQDDGDSTPASR